MSKTASFAASVPFAKLLESPATIAVEAHLPAAFRSPPARRSRVLLVSNRLIMPNAKSIAGAPAGEADDDEQDDDTTGAASGAQISLF
jgi:hypothetical protein